MGQFWKAGAVKHLAASMLVSILLLPPADAAGSHPALHAPIAAPASFTSQTLAAALYSSSMKASPAAQVVRHLRRFYPQYMMGAGAAVSLLPVSLDHFKLMMGAAAVAAAGAGVAIMRALRPLRFTGSLTVLTSLIVTAFAYQATESLSLSQITVVDLLQSVEGLTLIAWTLGAFLTIYALFRPIIFLARRIPKDSSPSSSYASSLKLGILLSLIALSTAWMYREHVRQYDASQHILKAIQPPAPERSFSLAQWRAALIELRLAPRQKTLDTQEFRLWLQSHHLDGETYYAPLNDLAPGLDKEVLALPEAAQKKYLEELQHFIMTPAPPCDFPTYAAYVRLQIVANDAMALYAAEDGHVSSDVRQFAQSLLAPIAVGFTDTPLVHDPFFERLYGVDLQQFGIRVIRFDAARALNPALNTDKDAGSEMVAALQALMFGWRPQLTRDQFNQRAVYWGHLKAKATLGDLELAKALSQLLAPYRPTILSAARQYGISPQLLAVLIAYNDVDVNFARPYKVSDAKMMERYYPFTQSLHLSALIQRFPQRLQDAHIPNSLGYYFVGNVVGTDARQGLGIRGYRIPQLAHHLPHWLDVGLRASSSKQFINLMQLNPDLDVEALAALVRFQIDYMIAQRAQGPSALWPDVHLLELGRLINPDYTPFHDPNLALLLATPGFGQFINWHTISGTAGNGIIEIDHMDARRFKQLFENVIRLVMLSGDYDPDTPEARAAPPLTVSLFTTTEDILLLLIVAGGAFLFGASPRFFKHALRRGA